MTDKEKEDNLNERIKRLDQIVEEQNKKIIPQHKDYVRMDGAIRQYKISRRGKYLHYDEI